MSKRVIVLSHTHTHTHRVLSRSVISRQPTWPSSFTFSTSACSFGVYFLNGVRSAFVSQQQAPYLPAEHLCSAEEDALPGGALF